MCVVQVGLNLVKHLHNFPRLYGEYDNIGNGRRLTITGGCIYRWKLRFKPL